MQNKPNFQDGRINLKSCKKKAYENKHNWTLSENKPNSKPIKPNLPDAQMNVSAILTKDYRKKDDFAVQKNKPNSKPNKAKLKRAKIDVNFYSTKDYENEPRLRAPGKQTQSKPISKAKKMLVLLTINGRRRSYFAARASLRASPSFLFSKVRRMAKPKSTGDERGNLVFDIRNPLFDTCLTTVKIRYPTPVFRCYPKTYKKYKKLVILNFKRFSLTSLS